MENNDTEQMKTPSEGPLLFWVFFLTVGTVVAATGTFSHWTMGRWGGDNVRVAGWLASGLSVLGIFVYFRRIWSRARGHHILVGAFIFAILVSLPIPFLMVAYDFGFPPMYWGIILFLFAHILHKRLTKGLGPTCHSTGRSKNSARR